MGITAINGIGITASLTNTASYARSVSGAAVGNTAVYYPFFSSVNGGTSNLFTNGSLGYNPGVAQLHSTYFSASLGFIGTASWATSASSAISASKANQVNTAQIATNAVFYPTFVDANNGAPVFESVYTDGNYTYNPSTNELRADVINNGSGGSVAITSDANLTVDASLTQSIYWVAAFTATRSLIINNITQGRQVRAYIRNTNATQRHIAFSGSTTTSGHSALNMAISAGGAQATVQPIAASNGTMFPIIENIGGFIVGGIM